MSSENTEQPQTTPPRDSAPSQEEDIALLDTLRMESRKRNRDAVVSERQEAMRNSKARRKLDMEAVKGGKRRRRRKSRKNKKSRKSKKRTNKSRRRRTNKRRRTRRKR